MKNIIKEISQNKNLQENIPAYADKMADLYFQTAAAEISMSYYTLYQILYDENDSPENSEYLKEIGDSLEELNDIIGNYVLKSVVDAEREEAIKRIEVLRDKVFNKVDVLSIYADIFSRYEYVANRCEYMFKDDEKLEKIKAADFAGKIIKYIFSDEDNSAINGRIAEVIAELPVRMTKAKFFERLRDGLSIYKKTDINTIDDFVYMIKSAAALSKPDGDNYPNLSEIYEMVKKTDYSSVTTEEHKALEDKLNYVAEYISKMTNSYMLLQELINKVYVLLINMPYTKVDFNENLCIKIISEVNNSFKAKEYMTLEEKITDYFYNIEGVPESLRNKVSAYEACLEEISRNHKKLVSDIMLENIYTGLFMSQLLMTDSLFMKLDYVKNFFSEDTEDDEEEISIDVYVKQKLDELIVEFTEFFKENQKIVNKFVMSAVLSRLPVFFNNVNEVQEYVYNSLDNCTNKAERYAAIGIISSIISDNSK